MIKYGENPHGHKGINKFIAKSGDGINGKLLSVNNKLNEGVILALNTSLKKDVIWGKLYHVKEIRKDEYPQVISIISSVPNTSDWNIIGIEDND